MSDDKPRPFDHVWHWRKRLPERKGERCRIIDTGRDRSVLIEFVDGKKVATTRNALRYVGPPPPSTPREEVTT